MHLAMARRAVLDDATSASPATAQTGAMMFTRSVPVLLALVCWACDSDSPSTGHTATTSAPDATTTPDSTTDPDSAAVPDTTAAATTTVDATAADTTAADTSVADSVAPDTTVADTTTTPGSTAGVLCDYSHSIFNASPSVNATSTAAWTCTASQRVLTANGLPDHDVGTFPNPDCPNTIAAQTVSASYTLTPAVTSAASTRHIVGYALNGVKFDPGTAGACDDSGSHCDLGMGTGAWKMEALGQSAFDFGTDDNNAHVQPGGAYHYHGMPAGLIDELADDPAMLLVGWAADGFPIYARYGYSVAGDATSALKVLTGSYRTKATPDASRPSTSLYAMGTFTQDWEYVAGSGDLDECNGRTGVTPEFPGGTYYYAITDTYPFIQRCVKGTAAAEQQPGGPGGGPPPGH